MNLFEMIKEQRDLLQKNGFDADGLGYPSAEDRFVDRLSNELRDKIHWSKWVPVVQDFRIDIAGLFGGDEDLVHFKFHYQYHPEEESLAIKAITARLQDTRLDFLIKEGEPFPKSKEIYLKLKQERSVTPVQENKEENIWRRRL